MTDKMREVFEKWYMTNTFAHVDHLSVFYNDLNCYSTPIVNHCWKAWQAAQSVPVGMRVSVDTSTGEHDAGNRVFAVVTGQQDDGSGGLMLLCEEESRNFEQSVPVVGEYIRSIKIPTDTMEQEFQHHYRQGYEAGKASNNAELEQLRKEYEQKQALLLDAHCERVSSLQDRIRQLEAERMSEEWRLVPVEPTEYEIRAACRALWESETHPVLTRAGHNTNFDFLPETILLSLRKKVRAVRKAMLAASAQQKKEWE